MSDPLTRLNAALDGRYHIERELGEGGMATVFLARDLKHKRNVALKVLKPELAAVVGAERFLAEIETTAKLQHPHILPLFDSGEADGFLFYVMPFVEGESLRDRLDREHQLPVDEAVRIASDVAEALRAAHARGVIHRDIKPANILLSQGRPLVADFGIALAVSAAGAGRLTETGLSLGTPHYMSPEQATGDHTVGPATDVYALGCVLYEMLVGDPPYIGSTAQAILGKIITGSPDLVTKYRKAVPAHVAAAVARALEKLPADRFRDPQELARALSNPGFRHGEGHGAGRVAEGTATSARLWKSATVALSAALVLAVAWPMVSSGPAPEPARYSIALPHDQAFKLPRNMTGLAQSPDGDWFVYTGGGDNDLDRLWVRPHGQLRATPLPGTEGAGNPSVSPDGTRVAFTGGPGNGLMRLMISSIGGGPPRTVEDSLVDNGGVSWGYDGYIYYDGHLEGDGIARVPVGGGTPEIVTMARREDGELWHSGPHALPNGKGVLFRVRRTELTYDVAAVDLTTGQQRILVPGAVDAQYSSTGHLLYVTEDGTLIARPFDQDALAFTGEPLSVVDGLQVRDLGRTEFALSGDGTLMYRTGGPEGLGDMVWVTRDGTASEVDPSWPSADFRSPALSPDGRQLAVTVVDGEGSHIWIKQLPDGRFTRFTLEGVNDGAAWTDDGRVLAYLSNQGETRDLYRRPADGSGPAQLVLDLDGGINRFAYSEDGAWLVYASATVAAYFDLYRVPLDPQQGTPTGEPALLRVASGYQTYPAISPDGRWLAYQSDETGIASVYVCPFPSCDVTYPVSTRGQWPTWSQDGRELFYVDRDASALMAVEVLPGTPAVWSGAREVFSMEGFDARGYAVAPDGSRFVAVRAAGSEQPAELIVVRNFPRVLEEMKASKGGG